MAVSIAIIGGGASGLMASQTAARAGAQVTLIEQCDRVGRKILATGNGRCNLTNLHPSASRYHGGTTLAAEVLRAVPAQTVLDAFADLGLVVTADEQGRVYPLCGQATAVLDVLRMACDRAGVTLRTSTTVRSIQRAPQGFSLDIGEAQPLIADGVIIATGGRAAPKLGSDGSGYALLTNLGHTLTRCAPGLVQLRCASPLLPSLKGLRAPGALDITIDGQSDRRAVGEILFADYGLSGIAAMEVSRNVAAAIHNKRVVTAHLCLLPDLSADEARRMIDQRCALFAEQPVNLLFTGLFPRRIGEALIKFCDITLDTWGKKLSPAQRNALAAAVRDWPFSITGTQGYDQAQVTVGGIDTADFDPATLESTLVPGLYATGEVLDVDGDCGGFNLHFAWATGLLAARAAAEAHA